MKESVRQKLFDYMSNEHEVMLMDSDFNEIILILNDGELDLERIIKQKEIELLALKEENTEIIKQGFNWLVDKYYILAVTCLFRVDSIESFDKNYVYVEGLKIHGNAKHSNEFSIELKASEAIHRDIKPREITEDEFLKFMERNVVDFGLLVRSKH